MDVPPYFQNRREGGGDEVMSGEVPVPVSGVR